MVFQAHLSNESKKNFGGSRYQPKNDGNCIIVAKVFRSFFGRYLDQPKKYKIYSLSFNFHFISTKKSIILTVINAGLFPTVVVEIHMTSLYSFSVDAKFNLTSVTPSRRTHLMMSNFMFSTSQQSIPLVNLSLWW